MGAVRDSWSTGWIARSLALPRNHSAGPTRGSTKNYGATFCVTHPKTRGQYTTRRMWQRANSGARDTVGVFFCFVTFLTLRQWLQPLTCPNSLRSAHTREILLWRTPDPKSRPQTLNPDPGRPPDPSHRSLTAPRRTLTS